MALTIMRRSSLSVSAAGASGGRGGPASHDDVDDALGERLVDRAAGDQEAVEQRAAEQVEGELVRDQLHQRVVQAFDKPGSHEQSRSVRELTRLDGSWHADGQLAA
jgi:hypothetical protein